MQNTIEEKYNEAIQYFINNDEATLNLCRKKFGIKTDTLSKKLKEKGINPNRFHEKQKQREQEIVNFLKREKTDFKECAKKFNVTRETVYGIAKRNNIITKTEKNKDNLRECMLKAIETYISEPTMSITFCAQKYGISRWILKNELIKRGIDTHKIVSVKTIHGIKYITNGHNTKCVLKDSFDDSYFEIIDNEEKAYWLGFILADGSIKKDTNSLRIGLSIRDYDHLHRFKKSIKSATHIREYDASLNGKKYPSCSFTITSKKLINDLNKLNIFANKSKKEKPYLGIPDNLIKHYIRGFFDGDGWISIYDRSKENKNQRCEIGFGSSKEMLLYIKEELNKNNIILNKITPFSSIFKITTSNQNEILKFIKYIYKDCSLYLPRKYEKSFDFCRLHSTSLFEE